MYHHLCHHPNQHDIELSFRCHLLSPWNNRSWIAFSPAKAKLNQKASYVWFNCNCLGFSCALSCTIQILKWQARKDLAAHQLKFSTQKIWRSQPASKGYGGTCSHHKLSILSRKINLKRNSDNFFWQIPPLGEAPHLEESGLSGSFSEDLMHGQRI